MKASVHTVAGSFVIIEHAAHGATLVVKDFNLTSLVVGIGDAVELDNFALAEQSTSSHFLYAICRVRLGVPI